MNQPDDQLCLFILSGEHETLPQAELCAILDAEGYSYRISSREGRILLMEVNENGAQVVIQRAGLVNQTSIVAFESNSEEQNILDSLQRLDFSQWLSPNDRFGVKVTRMQREPKKFNVDELQKKIGSEIWEAMGGKVKVSLKSPETLFLGVIVGNRFFFGPHLGERDRRAFSQRRSPFRPFFVPSAIHPKIARVLVNLSRAKSGGLFIDPFCGTGGLLLEASDIGCVSIGLDIDVTMLSGSHENLAHFGFSFFDCVADARNPPFRFVNFEAIATDPPYGRSSSTKGNAVYNLIEASLESYAHIMKSGGFLSIALPLEFFKEDMIPSEKFVIKETHTMRIHRSLQRHIVVLERK